MSELLKGPPLRLVDVYVSTDSNRLQATLVNDPSSRAVATVFANDDALPSVQANALLFMAAPRMHRALAALLKASRNEALGLDDGADKADAENKLDRAEREAAAALAAAVAPGSGGESLT